MLGLSPLALAFIAGILAFHISFAGIRFITWKLGGDFYDDEIIWPATIFSGLVQSLVTLLIL